MLHALSSKFVQGAYPVEINETIAAAAARGFARYTQSPAFVIGADARLSTPFLKTAITRALIDEGAYVIDIGLAPLPLVGFAMKTLGIPAGIMISASPDPPERNGLQFQILAKDGFTVQVGRATGLEEIEEGYPERRHYRAGKQESYDPLPAYLAYMTAAARGLGSMKIVADYGNGVGAIAARPLFERLRLPAQHLFPEPDGLEPNHSTDPDNEENFAALRAAVRVAKADVGLFFDGDAGRVRAVDEQCAIVAADIMLAILARDRFQKPIFRDSRLDRDNAVPDDGLLTSIQLMKAMTRNSRRLSVLAEYL